MADNPQRIPQTGAGLGLATRLLIQRLQTMQPGDFIAYADLMAQTDIASQVQLVRLLRTARRFLRDTHRLVFDPIAGQGIVCLTDVAKLGRMRRRRKELHTRAVNNVKDGQTVNPTNLDATQQYFHVAELVSAGAVALATAERTIQAIETTQTLQPLLMDPTLLKQDLFKGL